MKTIDFLINNHKLKVEVSDTPEKIKIGLSNRNYLDSDCGMLLIFSKPDMYWIWMKDMKFPIDVLWLDKNVIVDLKENISPKEGLNKIYPSENSTYILELNAGICKQHQIKKGDKIYISKE